MLFILWSYGWVVIGALSLDIWAKVAAAPCIYNSDLGHFCMHEKRRELAGQINNQIVLSSYI